MKRCFFTLLLALTCLNVNLSAQSVTKIAVQDSAYRVGKLENGLTYYIRKNNQPKERASFYLIQNVGSLLEEDNQNGLAHFLEHMAFNGSRNYPNGELLKSLSRHGVSLRNLNAYTGLNETVYNLSNIPTKNLSLIDSCILILSDWSCGIDLDDNEIEGERGVILEEFRTRNNAAFRLSGETNPVLFKGSKYAIRNVIGTTDIISTFKSETLRDYYSTWYRPDLQAVAIVGDIDVDAVEAKVIETFSKIKPAQHPKQRPFFEIPDHKDPYYVCAVDREARQPLLTIQILEKTAAKTDDISTYKRDYVINLCNSMINERVNEMLAKNKNGQSLVGGSIAITSPARGYSSLTINAGFYNNATTQVDGFKLLYRELERVWRDGFTQSELNMQVANMNMMLTRMAPTFDNQSNENYIESIKLNFLESVPLKTSDEYIRIAKKILPTITLQDISACMAQYRDGDNATIILVGPDKGVNYMTKEDVLSAISDVRGAVLAPYVGSQYSGKLIDTDLSGAKIVSSETLPLLGAQKWTLANGAKVVFNNTNIVPGSVILTSYSNGGTSLCSQDMAASALVASSMVNDFGVGDFDPLTLSKILAGKQVATGVDISELSEGVNGNSSTADFETLLQLIYLRFEKPRFDRDVYDATLGKIRGMIPSIQSTPAYIMQDSLGAIVSCYSPRRPLVNYKTINAITFEQVERIYRDRIKDASDFTFYIIGDIAAETVKPLVQKYLGSITSINRSENYVDHKIRFPKGKVEKLIPIKLEVPKSSVYVIQSSEMDYTPYNSLCVTLLREILAERYQANIREKEGGTYGVGVKIDLDKDPVSLATMTVNFDCDPSRAEAMKALVYKEIADLCSDGVGDQELANFILGLRKERQQVERTLNYKLAAIMSYDQYGIDITSKANFNDILDSMTKEKFDGFIKTMFVGSDVVDVIFCPKNSGGNNSGGNMLK